MARVCFEFCFLFEYLLFADACMHCLISYRGGLGTSLCIMGYGTQHPHSRKEHIELYNILKFGVNQANIRRDTAIQKLKNLLRNVWNAGHTSGVPYIS